MKKLFLILILIANFVYPQIFKKNNIAISSNYTTTSKLFYNPFSSDKVLRSNFIEINNFYSVSLEFRTKFFEEIFISASTEYLNKNFKYNNFNLSGEQVHTNDGIIFIPIEFSIYYYLPFSNENFNFFMGGGSSGYFGFFKREIGDQKIKSELYKFSYGITVSVGMEYLFYQPLSIRFQMKFRDPELIWKNSYTSNIVNYNGKTYLLNTSTFYSKLNIDGIIFSLGVVYNF
ncbi:MAG: hypothetical protein N2321_11070 [Melioribacteraceae bacterium]|nr:hypothetical protein [Melioribacteraceae bacterium]